MKTKFFSFLIGGVIALTSSVPTGTFNYKYQIKANSLNPVDSATAYYYKEKMIDKYEEYFFTLDENSQKEYVKFNLEFFALYDNITVKNQAGTICITIGEGKGITINGTFRKNECDEAIINEKYYILELFK